jgi:hypothetical protein
MGDVVTLTDNNIADVPSSLRRLADEIEQGDCRVHIAMVVIQDDEGEVSAYNYGNHATRAEAIGILQMASTILAVT